MSVSHRNRFRRLAVLLTGAAMLVPVAVQAQTAPAAPAAAVGDAEGFQTTREDDGSIVVTARRFVPLGAITASKTTAPLIETPQSVSVISRDQIDLLNFTDVQQAVRYTAGIVGENYGPDQRYDFLTLRGFIPVQYIDGLQAPVSSTISNVGIDLYGFDAVDVLKGPAAVLYGTTPPGGIYNLTSRRPSATTGGEVQAMLGTNDYKRIAGTVTGALADGLTARLTGLYRDNDIQTDYVTVKRAYIAPSISYDIGPDTRVTALGHYQWDRVEGDTNGFLPAAGVLFDNPVGKVSRSINLGEPDYNFYRRRQWAAGYELSHRFSGAVRFTQNVRWDDYSEYQQIIYASSIGADNRTVGRSNFPFKDDVQQFAADNRFDIDLATGAIAHRILIGFDYRNYREASAYAFGAATSIDLFNPVYSTTPIAVPSFTPFTDQRLKQSGLYVQDQARFGDVILTLSGRQDWTRSTNYAGATAVDTRQDKFSWRAGATYVSEMGIAPYVSYSTSFQPVVGSTFGGAQFSPSSGKQWEGGVKYDARGLGDDIRLFATAAVYRIRQSNVSTDDPAHLFFKVQAGEVTAKGAELELVTRIREQLSINASYTYTDAKFTDSSVAAQIGSRVPATPRHKATLFIDYTHDQGLFAGFGGGAGVRYLTSSPGVIQTAANQLLYYSPTTTLFDATLHYDIPGWRFAINGSNIFDKRYAGRCTGPTSCFFGASRQVAATVTKKF
jgi:iron complex outermembrane receptor protein